VKRCLTFRTSKPAFGGPHRVNLPFLVRIADAPHLFLEPNFSLIAPRAQGRGFTADAGNGTKAMVCPS
jgi:hypothetical protein